MHLLCTGEAGVGELHDALYVDSATQIIISTMTAVPIGMRLTCEQHDFLFDFKFQ